MSTQSNPVVFITLGKGAEIWPVLSENVKEYMNNIGYIHVGDDFDDDWLKSEVGRVWREFLQIRQNASDSIRLNYIMCTDEVGLWLPTLRQSLEKYFHTLYPAGVFMDVYCLLDDRDLLERNPSHKNVMRMLQEEQAELEDLATGLRVYLLSNLNSQNTFTPEDSIPKTIALLTLFKDCAPDIYVTGADASRYNEFYFLENCQSRHGRFLTASSIHLTIPQSALKALLMVELLSYGKDESVNPRASFIINNPSLPSQPVKSMDYLYGLAIPEIKRAETNTLTRRNWIEKLFGTRLDSILLQAINQDNNSSLGFDLDLESMTLYDVLRSTSQGGIGYITAIESVAQAEDNLRNAEEKCSKWLDDILIFSKNGAYVYNGIEQETKRRLSPMVTQDLWPYFLATEYLDKHRDLIELRQKTLALGEKQQSIIELHSEYSLYLKQVQNVISSYSSDVQELNTVFLAFTPKATEYFCRVLKGFANEYCVELMKISKEMIESLKNNTFPEFVTRLETYIDDKVLKSKYFDKSLMEILKDMVSKNGRGDVASALGEWVYKNRHWNVRLKIGYTSLYTETNLYMPAEIAANVKKSFEERGMGRMNLFAEEDAKQVAVLNHSGAFNLDDLYYEGIYV